MKNKFNTLLTVSATVLILCLSGCGEKTAEEHMLAAEQFIAADNSQAAVLELKNAIRLEQNSGLARFKLGAIYLQQEQFESAEKELNRALELGYPASEVMPLISIAYKETGASNALIKLSHTNSSLSASENAKIGFYKLVAYVDLNQTEQATKLINELLLLDTESVYKGLANAYVSILDENYESALTQVKLLHEQVPLNEDVLRLESKLHLFLGQKEEATELLGELYNIRPNNIELKFSYVLALMDIKRFEDAKPLIDNLLLIDPNNGILNQFKGTILAEKKDYSAALEYLKKAIVNGRDSSVTQLLAGFSAYQIGDFEEAIKHLSLIAGSLPSGHPALRILADSQLKLGQSQDASETLLGLTDFSGNDASLFSRAGYQLIQQGNVEKAKQVVAEGEKIGKTAQDLLQLGVLQLSLNDVSGILKLEEAVKQAPDLAITQQTLASAYLLAGETEKANALVKSWKKQQPTAYQPYILEGELAQNAGDFDKAKAIFERASSLATNNAAPEIALANLLIAEDKNDEAIASLVSILDNYPNNTTALGLYFSLLTNKGDASDAVNRAKRALENNIDNLSLQLTLARMQFQQRDFKASLATLEPIVEDETLPFIFWQIKGQALLRLSLLDDASVHYAKWLEVAPYNKDALLGVLLTKDAKSDYESALKLADDYAQKRTDYQVDILRAYFNVLLGNKQNTSDLLATLPPNTLSLAFVRGIQARLALLDNNFTDALNNANASYSAKPTFRNLLVYIRALDGTQNQAESFAVISQFALDNPDDQRAKLLLAERLIQQDKQAAISQYEESLKTLPNNFLVLNNLAYLYYEEGRFDDALPLAKKAMQQRPSNVDAADTLAQVYIAQDELKKARKLYDDILPDRINNDDVMLHIIDLYMKMGDTELAKRRLSNRQWLSPEVKQKAVAIVSSD